MKIPSFRLYDSRGQLKTFIDRAFLAKASFSREALPDWIITQHGAFEVFYTRMHQTDWLLTNDRLYAKFLISYQYHKDGRTVAVVRPFKKFD